MFHFFFTFCKFFVPITAFRNVLTTCKQSKHWQVAISKTNQLSFAKKIDEIDCLVGLKQKYKFEIIFLELSGSGVFRTLSNIWDRTFCKNC